MKIVLYTNSFLPNIGGREIVVHHLALAYKELGHQVRVVGPGGFLKNRKYRFEYSVHRWPQLKGMFREQVWLTQMLLDVAACGCDVLHAHNTYPAGYIASKLKAKMKFPLVITPHGMDIHVIPEIGFGLRLDPVRNKKIAYAIDQADLCTAISASIERSLMDTGANQAKIRNVPNGVDLGRFQKPFGMDVKKWLGLDESASLIVTVGNYHPRKGQDILIRSMPTVLKKHPNARLIIVGKDTLKLNALVSELSLTGKVFLMGSIGFPYFLYKTNLKSNSDEVDLLAAIYRGSDVYVSAGISEGAEGLSLAVIEAMAAGLPILASDISGNRDMIENGKSGYLFAPNSSEDMAEAIVGVLGDKQKQTGFAAMGKKIARQYDWLNIAKQYLDVYAEAIKISSLNG